MTYGLDEEMEKDETEKREQGIQAVEKPKRKPFAYWTVGGRDYKLKLTTSVICQLEDKFKKNLLSLLDGVPPLAVMLTIVQGAMKPWEHGMKYADVQKLFDRYCEEGGTQLSFMTDVLIPIYSVSGFFSESQQEAMEEKLADAKELM